MGEVHAHYNSVWKGMNNETERIRKGKVDAEQGVDPVATANALEAQRALLRIITAPLIYDDAIKRNEEAAKSCFKGKWEPEKLRRNVKQIVRAAVERQIAKSLGAFCPLCMDGGLSRFAAYIPPEAMDDFKVLDEGMRCLGLSWH